MFVTVEVQGRKLILLSGARAENDTGRPVAIEELEKLLDATRRNPDAVAFGYLSGRWVAAA